MSITSRISSAFRSYGEKQTLKELEAKYGQQIGKVAKNGNKTFQKKAANVTTTTGLTWDNKVIAEVENTNNVVSGISKKIKRNSDGDIVEVSHSRRATNYRNNVSENIETGEVKSKVLTYGTRDGHPQHQVTTTTIDKSGKITSDIKDVKINGKNYATENEYPVS